MSVLDRISMIQSKRVNIKQVLVSVYNIQNTVNIHCVNMATWRQHQNFYPVKHRHQDYPVKGDYYS